MYLHGGNGCVSCAAHCRGRLVEGLSILAGRALSHTQTVDAAAGLTGLLCVGEGGQHTCAEIAEAWHRLVCRSSR